MTRGAASTRPVLGGDPMNAIIAAITAVLVTALFEWLHQRNK